jgi:class 3 adenylate cyclase
MIGYLTNLSVRGKIVLLISAVVSLLLAAVLAVLWVQNRYEVKTVIEHEFQGRETAFLSIERYRLRDRAHLVYLITSKTSQLIKQADKAERCQYLQQILNLQSTDPDDSSPIDYVALRGTDGQLLAIALRGHPLCASELEASRLPDVHRALGDLPLVTTWQSPDGDMYTVYVARVNDGPEPTEPALGTLSVGYRLDNATAALFKKRAGVDVVFWNEEDSPTRGVGTVVFATSDPNLTSALTGKLDASNSAVRFKSGGELYLLKEVELSVPDVILDNPERVHTAVVQSISQRLRSFTVLRNYLLIMAACALLLGVVLGVIFSSPIVKPLVGLANVAREVEKGKYDGIQQLRAEQRREFESRDEIGTLCRAFEDMVTGLAQRQEMSKYMSHSAMNSLAQGGPCPSERKWMCVLFSDIRNFSGYSDGRDPESVVQRLNQVLGIQAEAVGKHGGDIDKFIGDAMFAFFTGDDRCQRAVAAAREMLAELNTRIGPYAGAQIGVGIHVGEVIAGALGSQNRRDYTAIGSTVNLSERLCSVAQRGQILISQAVATELGDSVPLHPLDPIHVKGFAEEIHVYEVVMDVASRASTASDDIPKSTA